MLHRLDEIPVLATLEQVIDKLLVEDDEDVKVVEDLFMNAKSRAKPKALYREVFVEETDGERVTISGTGFHSVVLAAALKKVHRVFAYVCTCGTEVDSWSRAEPDYFKSLWLDMIKQMFLNDATQFLREYIKNKYQFEKLSAVNPGSGNEENWPISQQRPLFEMIGDVRGEIGVRLTDSFLMVPIKSTSGILFPSETDFVNCALCGRENCVGRRAEFDAELYRKTFGKNGV